MYIIIYSTILINIIFINKILFGTIIRLNVLFSALWCIGAGVASLGLFDTFEIPYQIHIYVITILLIFNLVYFIFSTKNKNTTKVAFFSIKDTLNPKIIYIINFTAWLYSLKFLLRSMDIIINQGGFTVLRASVYSSHNSLGTTAEMMILQTVVNAIFTSTILLAVVLIIIKSNHKSKNTIIVISLVDIAIYTILFGGRSILLYFAIFYILGIITYNSMDETQIKAKINKKLIFLILIVLAFLTVARAWGEVNFIETIILYTTGGFNYLSKLIEETNMENVLWGTATFGFLFNIIAPAISLLFGVSYFGSDHLITQVTAIPRYISPTHTYNANTTMIYPLLRDFGYFGLIFGTFFLALISIYAEEKFNKERDIRWFAIFILILNTLANSIRTYDLLLPKTTFTILFIFLSTKKLKIDNIVVEEGKDYG